MSIFRTILVVFIALAVAMLPAAGGFSPASAEHGAMLMTASPDCCPEGGRCNKVMPDCGSLAGCMLKCSAANGALPTPFALALTVSAKELPQLASQNLPAPSENPPAPPPRF